MAVPTGYECIHDTDIAEIKVLLTELRVYVDNKIDAMQLILTGTQINNASIAEQLNGLFRIVREIKETQTATNQVLSELTKKPGQRLDLISAVVVTAIITGVIGFMVAKVLGGI